MLLGRAGLAAAGPAAGPALGPSQADIIGQMKGELSDKIGNSFDADYILDRGTTVPPGYRAPDGSRAEPLPFGAIHDIAPDEGFPAPEPPRPPGPGPAPAPGTAPAPMAP